MSIVIKGRTIYGPSIVLDGLILYFDSNNLKSYPGTGNKIYDLTENNHIGTINLGEIYTDGNLKYLRNVDNISNSFYISVPHGTVLNNTLTVTEGGWTIEEIIWTNSCVYPEADAPGVASQPAYPIPNIATGFDWNHAINVNSFKFGQSSDFTTPSTYEDAVTFSVPSPYNTYNSWRVRTMVWDRENNQNRLYINGNFINFASMPNTTGQPLYDGGGIVFGTCYGWRHYGRRTTIKIYNRILSLSDIQKNFNSVRQRYQL